MRTMIPCTKVIPKVAITGQDRCFLARGNFSNLLLESIGSAIYEGFSVLNNRLVSDESDVFASSGPVEAPLYFTRAASERSAPGAGFPSHPVPAAATGSLSPRLPRHH
jgi:hypothetical protein